MDEDLKALSNGSAFPFTVTWPEELLGPLQESLSGVSLLQEVQKEWEKVRVQIQQNLQDHQRNLPLLLGFMAENSWYPDFEIPLNEFRGLEQPAGQQDIQTIDAFLSSYFRTNHQIIETNLCQMFPHRTRILQAAFDAFRLGNHVLDIPVFLAQADGISYEILNKNFFTKRHSIRAARTYVSDPSFGDYAQMLLEPLHAVGSIRKNTQDLPVNFNGLNRHKVMHGNDVAYGSELNSLKAISLLSYLYHVMLWKP